MPKIDKELKDKGYIPVLASLAYKAASQRKEGYLEALTSKAIIRDGVFYLSKEDYDNLRKEFNNSPPNGKINVTVVSELEQEVNQFIDIEKSCPRAEWESLREKYIEEINDKKQVGCSTCQLNSIKRKYKSMLLNNTYE